MRRKSASYACMKRISVYTKRELRDQTLCNKRRNGIPNQHWYPLSSTKLILVIWTSLSYAFQHNRINTTLSVTFSAKNVSFEYSKCFWSFDGSKFFFEYLFLSRSMQGKSYLLDSLPRLQRFSNFLSKFYLFPITHNKS